MRHPSNKARIVRRPNVRRLDELRRGEKGAGEIITSVDYWDNRRSLEQAYEWLYEAAQQQGLELVDASPEEIAEEMEAE